MNVSLHTCMSKLLHSSVHRDQKRALDPLELELEVIESHHVSAGNSIWSLARAMNPLNSRNISLASAQL